ncbi:MAG: hypothetical protein OEV37_00985 [Candidatus Berkelbacteria bacterium]|nr:hypothetical protein [Candidatus Berkelbacteria bacterium]
MNKTCKQCDQKFVVEDEDLEFYKKISPTFAGKTYEIPPPTLCPKCRDQRRMVWEASTNLYKRKCDKTQENIISIYSPDKPYKVWKNIEIWKDDWDPLKYGCDFDSKRDFFSQFESLFRQVPKLATLSTIVENCEYCQEVWHLKDSYLCFIAGYAESCYYSNEILRVKDCVDCFYVRNCENCYFCTDCDKCNSSTFLEHCENCTESHFSYDCKGCNNVLLCTNLRNKQYYIKNKKYTKEKYFEEFKKINLSSRSIQRNLINELKRIKLGVIRKSDNNKKSEGCTGDYLVECKNCKDSYNSYKCEGCKKIYNIDSDAKDCQDLNISAEMQLCYEGESIAGYKHLFCTWATYGDNNLYCNHCEYCSRCFGCVGLRHKQYCILNKQYSKQEYEKLTGQIIEKMQKDGEWGEFFPVSISPFGYNETVAMDYFPLEKEGALKLDAKWQDKDYGIKYNGPFYEPKDDIDEYIENENEREKLLAGILKCEISNKPFKIMPQELAYYLKNKIPIPTKHYNIRYKERFALRNPRKLWHRKCMNQGCKNEFETTYAPDRPEKVYCEDCYQKSVI